MHGGRGEMKILVLSDTHGRTERCVRVIERERPQMILHLGDRVGDAERLVALFSMIPLRAVSGNCDFGRGAPERVLIEPGGVKIFLCHGHTLGAREGTDGILRAARERGAQVALFGHTHRGLCDYREGIWLMNPGSLSEPRGCPPSYGLVTISGDSPTVRVIPYEEEW